MTEHAMINIRDFGARGDGKADDTGAIRQAVAQAAQTGATVFVPDGTFLTTTISIPPHVGMAGNPTWDFRDFGGSILRLGDDRARCLIDLTGAIGTTLDGLCLDGAGLGDAIHGVLIDKEDNHKEEDTPCIERCRVSRFTGDGVRLDHVWCFTVRSCMVSDNGGNGLYVRGWDGFILDNWLSNNREAGYGAYGKNAAVTMTGNRIEWNAGGGIVVCGGNYYNMTGNYVDRSGGPGIALLPRGRKPCEVFSITGNIIFRSGAPHWRELEEHEDAHLRFERVHGLTCTGNTMRAGRNDRDKGEWSPRYGIVYRALENAVIRDNAMDRGALEALTKDLGGHGDNVSVKDNVGNLFVEGFGAEWEGD